MQRKSKGTITLAEMQILKEGGSSLPWKGEEEIEERQGAREEKTIHECSERQRRSQRRKWREAQAKSRAAKKAASVAINSLFTTPVSPESPKSFKVRIS